MQVAIVQFSKVAIEELPEKIREYSSSQVGNGGEYPCDLGPIEEIKRQPPPRDAS